MTDRQHDRPEHPLWFLAGWLAFWAGIAWLASMFLSEHSQLTDFLALFSVAAGLIVCGVIGAVVNVAREVLRLARKGAQHER